MAKRLFIDLYKCDDCTECDVKCSYIRRAAGLEQNGILALREMAQFALVCRRCEEPSCAAACRFDALERQSSGVMRRYNMRCVSCKSCVHACPFGTIYPDTVPFYVSRCDFCLGRLKDGEKPVCVDGCAKGAVDYVEIESESEEEGIYFIGEHLAVRAPRWKKRDE